jgi:hypothetical protein
VIDLFFEHRHRIALVRFSGDLTMDDLARLKVAARYLIEHEGPARRILDFTAVGSVQVKTSVIASMGTENPEIGDRIYVVPRPEIFGLARVYSAYQRHGSGTSEPMLVATLGEAYTAFGLVAPDFQPYVTTSPALVPC